MTPAQPLNGSFWHVQLLGGVIVRSGDLRVEKLPSRGTAALLARLALFPQRAHAREELATLLWPDADAAAAANRLRNALATLRKLLEPPGTPRHSVLQANRLQVRLQPVAYACDVLEFERLAREGEVDAARSLFRGELMPGFYDDWIDEERHRLNALHDRMGAPRPRAASLQPPPRRRLRHYADPFFGRDAETAALLRALATQRLVTVTGFGGSGKTRLCNHVAALTGGFDSVTFVALADCTSAAHAADRVRVALDLPQLPDSDAKRAQLVAHLGPQRALLLLDNFEQLATAEGAEFVSALLADLPRLHLLLSSRLPTRLPQEHELALQPLPLPTTGAAVERLAANPCVALYASRAGDSRAGFGVHADNAAALVALCQALGGLPLAIEIAASRVRRFPPEAMCAALAGSLRVLARSGPRAAQEPRHASLSAVLQTSWDLLGADEQALLQAASAFRGDWTAAQAAAVAPAAGVEGRLAVLVAHGLVQHDTASGRYRLPRSVRDFVDERLPDADAARLRQRHREHFTALARQLDTRHDSPGAAELPNLEQALATALTDGVATDGSLVYLLARALQQAGRAADALAGTAAVLARATPGSALHTDALLADAWVRWRGQRDGALALGTAREAWRCAVALGEPRRHARAARLLGAVTLVHLGEIDAAAALFDEAEAASTAAGDPLGALLAGPGRVSCLQARGRYREAAALAVAGEQAAAAMGHVDTQLLLQNRLSASLEAGRDFAQALEVCRRAARLACRHDMRYDIAYALWNQARPLLHLRQAADAARLLAFSRRLWLEQLGPLDANDEIYVRRVQRLGTRLLGRAHWQACWAEGEAMEAAAAYALGCGEGAPPI